MSNPRESRQFTFGGPADYRIVVQGSIDAGATDRLGGMQLDATSDEDDARATTLVGRLKDQAHLAGVLKTLGDMHLPILEVKKLDD